jgi:nucleotide-binding universal stress UspA family protein
VGSRTWVVAVGVDFGPRGDDALAEAFKLCARCAPISLHAVYVLDPSDIFTDAGESTEAAQARLLAAGPEKLRRRIAMVSALFIPPVPVQSIQTHVRLGKIVDSLRQFAFDIEADLLIVSPQARRGIARLVHPSVVEQLVRSAPCPVLVAKPRLCGQMESAPADEATPANGATRS